jgi:hypothetical protein
MARLIVAKTGGTIDDDVKDLAFDSDENYMVILEERIDTADGSGNLEITHNLGYLPSFYHFYESSAGVWERQLESGLGGAYTDTTKIYIQTPSASQRVKTVIWGNSQDNAVGTGRTNATGKLRIAKDGYDATIDTDLRRFKFASSGGVFKISEKKTLSITVTGSGTFTKQYAHGLGYVPQVYVFAGGLQIPIFQFIAAGMSYFFSYTIDDTNLTVTVENNGGGMVVPVTIDFNAQILLDKIE